MLYWAHTPPQATFSNSLLLSPISYLTFAIFYFLVLLSRLSCPSMKPLLTSHSTITRLKPFLKISLPKVHINWTHISSRTTFSTELSRGTSSILTAFHSPGEKGNGLPVCSSVLLPEYCSSLIIRQSGLHWRSSPSTHCLYQYPGSSSTWTLAVCSVFLSIMFLGFDHGDVTVCVHTTYWCWKLSNTLTTVNIQVPLHPPDHYDQTLNLSSNLNGHTFKSPNSRVSQC